MRALSLLWIYNAVVHGRPKVERGVDGDEDGARDDLQHDGDCEGRQEVLHVVDKWRARLVKVDLAVTLDVDANLRKVALE